MVGKLHIEDDPSLFPRFVSVEAESALVGSMLLSQAAIEDTLSVRACMVWHPAHRAVFQAVRFLYRTGRSIDLVTVRNALAEKGLLADAGGQDYLVSLMESTPTASSAAYYAEIVRDKWVQRELESRLAKGMESILGDDSMSADEKVGWATTIADGLRDPGESEVGPEAVFALTDDVKPGVATGIMAIDSNTQARGLYPDAPNYIAGKQGSGKTNLLVQCASSALRQGTPVVFASLELPAEKVIRRFMRQLCGFSSRKRAVDADRGDDWDRAAAEFQSWPLKIWDARTDDLFVESVCERAVSAYARSPFGLMVVDYMQLLESRKVKSRDGNKTPVMEEAERWVRRTNLRLGNVWALGSQLTSNQGDLYTANSQEIEKGASLVLFLLREGETSYVLRCKKNRDGTSGWDEQIGFDPYTLRFFQRAEQPKVAEPPAPQASEEYDPFHEDSRWGSQ